MIVPFHYPYSARCCVLYSTSENQWEIQPNSFPSIHSFIFIPSLLQKPFHSPSCLVATPPPNGNSYCATLGCCIPNKLEQISGSPCTSSDIEQGQCGFVSISMYLRHRGVKTLCSISESNATTLFTLQSTMLISFCSVFTTERYSQANMDSK